MSVHWLIEVGVFERTAGAVCKELKDSSGELVKYEYCNGLRLVHAQSLLVAKAELALSTAPSTTITTTLSQLAIGLTLIVGIDGLRVRSRVIRRTPFRAAS
jgi:hypothetical protein